MKNKRKYCNGIYQKINLISYFYWKVRNIIKFLNDNYIEISPEIINNLFDVAEKQNFRAK